jgi:cob(I)alamin adenosyltransferase
MKLYTRSGDDGSTGLFGGERVGKDHPRVEAYGTVDELNACLGLAAAACDAGTPAGRRMGEILTRLQSRLFDLGADLATPASSPHAAKIHRIGAAEVREAEQWIDEIDGGNDPLRVFVLPGGSELASRLHLARAVCRRAERRAVNLARGADVGPECIKLLNRIGDLLFAMARAANKATGVGDVPWEKGLRD